jgi:NAD(P)-dependent dehydrogenase (short-subunit alcohol dehydrogenase family)
MQQTKAEMLILTRRFAMELGQRGITVNAVAPGWIVTEMASAGHSNGEFQSRVRNMSERTMVGRTGRPDESPTPWHSLRHRNLRNRWFADSPLEGDGFEPSVPPANEPRCLERESPRIEGSREHFH